MKSIHKFLTSVSYLICLTCIAIFTLQVVNPSFTEHMALCSERLWRLDTWLTNMFMHSDLSHLLNNILFILPLGYLVERIMNDKKKFLKIVILAGIIGAMASMIEAIILHDIKTYAVGASGILSALFGMTCYYSHKVRFGYFIFGFIVLLTGFQWYVSYIEVDIIAHSCHFFALLAGFILPHFMHRRFIFKASGKHPDGFDGVAIVRNMADVVEFIRIYPSYFKMEIMKGSREMTETEITCLDQCFEKIMKYCQDNGIKYSTFEKDEDESQ